MLIKYATHSDIMEALRVANLEFNNNLTLNCFEYSGKHFRVTLKVKNSKDVGARRSVYDGHRLIFACWHAHGTFFDALPQNTEIVTARGKTYSGAHWDDWNIGSMMYPFYFSDACACCGEIDKSYTLKAQMERR